ncbi:hypothetical protein [Chitinolyticbacter meiyuanensis]|uniref:hypothetical protein n=1 Tax=Chitinolyticbacter meiyuanensis TaxID=682798 RepID=UPI0011E5B7F6|nr:hypothetical protein [Chitinolyticbacter meiyuanensis]
MVQLIEDNGWYLTPQQQLRQAEVAIGRAADAADPLALAGGLLDAGRCLEALWQPQQALHAFEEAQSAAARLDGPQAGQLRCHARLGSAAIHYAHADYARALGDWGQALTLADAVHDPVAQGEALVGIGRICQVWNRADAALGLQQRALALPGLDARMQAMVALNVVSNLNALHRHHEMLGQLAEARALIDATPGTPFLAEWHVYCALAHAGIGTLQISRRHLDAALALADGANNHWARAFCLLETGKLAMRAHQPVVARQALEQALEIAEALGLVHTLKDIHQALTQLCEQQGNVAEAFEHHKLFHQYYAWAQQGMQHSLLSDWLQ